MGNIVSKPRNHRPYAGIFAKCAGARCHNKIEHLSKHIWFIAMDFHLINPNRPQIALYARERLLVYSAFLHGTPSPPILWSGCEAWLEVRKNYMHGKIRAHSMVYSWKYAEFPPSRSIKNGKHLNAVSAGSEIKWTIKRTPSPRIDENVRRNADVQFLLLTERFGVAS